MVTRFRDASDIQLSLRLYRLLELLGNLERLLTICVLRCDPALPAIFITETSCPKLRFRMSPNARHPITKLITSSSIQAFPRRLTLSESSRIKLFLDLSGRRHRKQVRLPSPPDSNNRAIQTNFLLPGAKSARHSPLPEQGRRRALFSRVSQISGGLLCTQRLLDKLALTRAQEMLGPYFRPDWQTETLKLFGRGIAPMHPLEHETDHSQLDLILDDWTFLLGVG